MRVNLDKNLNKDMFHTIKITINYPPKLAWNKMNYLNFCKLAQSTKELIILQQVVPPFDLNEVIDDVNNNFSIQSGVFSSLFQFFRDTLFCVMILKQTYKRKKKFQDGKEYNHKQHF